MALAHYLRAFTSAKFPTLILAPGVLWSIWARPVHIPSIPSRRQSPCHWGRTPPRRCWSAEIVCRTRFRRSSCRISASRSTLDFVPFRWMQCHCMQQIHCSVSRIVWRAADTCLWIYAAEFRCERHWWCTLRLNRMRLSSFFLKLLNDISWLEYLNFVRRLISSVIYFDFDITSTHDSCRCCDGIERNWSEYRFCGRIHSLDRITAKQLWTSIEGCRLARTRIE